MLTIRGSQMAVFRAVRVVSFIDEMTGYLATEYPKQHERLGATGTRAFVERA